MAVIDHDTSKDLCNHPYLCSIMKLYMVTKITLTIFINETVINKNVE